MRISKLMMSLVLLTSMATVATASASSNCNSRSGVPRTGNTNPEKATVQKSSGKSTKASSSKAHHGRK